MQRSNVTRRIGIKALWLFASAVAFSFSVSAAIRVAYLDVPPYAYLDAKSQPQGYLIDAFREAAHVIDATPEFIHLPHRRKLAFIAEGNVDLWAGLKNSRVAKHLALVSDVPLFTMQLNVFWRKGTEAVTSITDLKDKKLILISSYSYGGHYRRLSEQNRHVTYALNHEDGFDKLLSGQETYLLGYQRISDEVIEKFQLTGFQRSTVASYDLHLKMSVTYPDADREMAKINTFLAAKSALE